MIVVVLEDSEPDRRAIVAAAQAAGARSVVEAADAAAARAAAVDAAIAVVVCPPTAAAELAAAATGAVVVVSAATEASDAALAALLGPASDFLALPVDATEVGATLARALAQAAAEAATSEAERALAGRRADLSTDLAALARQVAEGPRTERLRAELSAAVVGELAVCIAPVPAHLERAAGEVGDSPAGSAIVDSLFAAQAAVRMVSDLHDTVRSERAPLPAVREILQTSAFIDTVLGCVARVASDYEATIDVVRLTAADDFSADRLLLQRALENMLECGLRRSRKGRLRFEVAGAGPAIRFDVVDSGGAVPDRLLPSLFTRLARLEGGTIQRGAALGLCRAVAQALGGSVYATAEANGLRLTLELPRVASEIAA